MEEKLIDSKRSLIETANLYEACKKARGYVKFLELNKFIYPETAKEITDEIDKTEKENFVFITKPFRRNESIEKSLYMLMKSRIRALDELTKEWRHEDR